MKSTTKFVGLDVSKEKMAVAVADMESREPRFVGEIPHTPEAIRKLIQRLGPPERLQVCYEAGPTGFGLQRQLERMGVDCVVVAPTLIPTRAGDRVKTDRRDALRLAQLLRVGELTPVHVPDEADEALRDLTRAREDAKEDLLRARHRLSKWLLRHDLRPPQKTRSWSSTHRLWLDTLRFEHRALQMTLQEYLRAIDEAQARVKRLETEIHEQAQNSPRAPVIQALQALRGVAETTAVTLVAEVGTFTRFDHPRQLMAYAGIVPREYSSGTIQWRGGITKTGNAHLRRVLVESAWSYRYRPAVKGAIKKRQEGLSPEIQAIGWKAQDRLHRKYMRMLMRGKSGPVAATAVARELLGFIWATAREAEEASTVGQVA